MAHNQQDEATRLAALFAGRPDALIGFLSSQLSVLKTQSQMILGLSGLVVTVTGFSGHNMVRGGVWSTTAMIVGIAFVLIGVVTTLRVSARLRWVSHDLEDDLVATTLTVIRRRDAQSRALMVAGAFVGAGLGAYLVSVVLAALAIGARMGPPPS